VQSRHEWALIFYVVIQYQSMRATALIRYVSTFLVWSLCLYFQGSHILSGSQHSFTTRNIFCMQLQQINGCASPQCTSALHCLHHR
jgi:hypothetical protein